MRKIFYLSFSIFIFLNGCKRFEEGPSISFRSIKGRLSGTWSLEYFSIRNADYTKYHYPNGLTFTITKGWEDGYEGKVICNDSLFGPFLFQADPYKEAVWSLEKRDIYTHEDIIRIEFFVTANNIYHSARQTYDIIRLTNKEMWLYEPSNPDKDFYKFKKIK